MALNGWALNSYPVNGEPSGTPSDIIAEGQGPLIRLSQLVNVAADSDLLITFSQEVQFQETAGEPVDPSPIPGPVAGEPLIYIDQSVISAPTSGNLITITQLVIDADIGNFLTRNGWYPVLVIGNFIVPPNWIHGSWTVTRTENEASQMTFTLMPPKGLQNPEAFQGLRVTMDVYYPTGQGRRVFTGYINIPDVDIIAGKTTFTCSDLRREQINAQLGAVAPYVGFYDEDVFGPSEDLADQMDKRLSTTIQALDFDAYGQYFITSIMPKALPDVLFPSSLVYRDNGRDPSVEYVTRSRVVNTVNIVMQYQYQRLFYRRLSYSWDADWPGGICGFLRNGYSIAKRETIASAIDNTGWQRTNLTYIDLPANGYYNCSGTNIAFSTATVSGVKTLPKKDSQGNNITDSNGNVIYESGGGVVNDSRNLLAAGAGWQMTKRWAQNVMEYYTFTLTAPQSILKYGPIVQNDSVGVESKYDSSGWETYEAYSPPPAGGIQNGADFIYNVDDSRAKFQTAFNIALGRAYSTIVRSHRNNYLTFNTPINAYIELYHTVKVDAPITGGAEIEAQGKVYRLVHTFNFSNPSSNTEITIAMCRSIGSASNSVLAPPAIPYALPPIAQSGYNLTSHYGVDSPNFTGFIGNQWVNVLTGGITNGQPNRDYRRTSIEERFVVPAPTIENAVRNNVVFYRTANYTLALPNNLLMVVY